jgi:hypothetical protein
LAPTLPGCCSSIGSSLAGLTASAEMEPLEVDLVADRSIGSSYDVVRALRR